MSALDQVLGTIEPPTSPRTRQRRPALDLSEEAVEERIIAAARQRAVEATPAEDQPDHRAPAWVDKVRDWVAPAGLLTRDVQVDFAVGKLIQAGKTGALVAAGGTGKTTLLLTLGVCHVTGREFMGLPVKRGAFVLMSIDDSQEDLDGALARVMQAMRLTAMEAEMVDMQLRVISLQGEPGLKAFTAKAGAAVVATGLEELILQALEGIPGLVGIALDTLRQFSGGNTVDEEVIKITVSGATEVARRTGAYVIVPHHTGKQNFRDGVTDMYCGSGSAAIADNCRFVLLLQTSTWGDIEAKVKRTGQERGDPLVLISTRGSLLVRAPAPLFMHRDGFLIGRIAGEVLSLDQQADEKSRAVLNAVRRGAQTKNAIYAEVAGRKSACMSLVDDLLHRGLLIDGSESGSGKHPKLMVTSAGARLLDDAL